MVWCLKNVLDLYIIEIRYYTAWKFTLYTFISLVTEFDQN